MQEGKIVDIPIKGIVRDTPGALSSDGEMEEMVNLRYKDGAFRPIPALAQYADVTGYNNLYIHSNEGYKHILGVQTGELKFIGIDAVGVYSPLLTPISICTIIGTATYTQIGNVINILDDEGLKYAVWYNNTYVFINTAFDGSQTSTASPVGRIDLRVTGGLGITGKREVRLFKSDGTFGYGNTGDADATDARQLRADSTNGLLLKAISSLQSEGKLTGFFLACTAIELYDGSYIRHSNPILCGEAWDEKTRYLDLNVGTETFNYRDKQPVIFPKAYGDGVNIGQERLHVESGNLHMGGHTLYPKDTDGSFSVEFDGADCYLPNSDSENIYTSNQVLPNLLGYYDKRASGDVPGLPVWVWASYNKLQFKTNQTIDSSLAPLIKSVSVFITPAVQLYKTDGKSHFIGQSSYTSSLDYWIENHLPVVKTNEELRTEIKDLKTFYKVHEIPFEDIVTASTSLSAITPGTWVDVDLKDKLGDNLVSLEALPIDPFSHHTFMPKQQFVYNSKLHVANYRTLLSRGFSIDYLYANQGVGQFPTELINPEGDGWIIKTDIKTTLGTSSVVRYKQAVIGDAQAPNMLSPMLSYPDSRAVKMTITKAIKTDMGWYSYTKEYPLTAHDTLNFAYYLSDDLKPIASDYIDNQAIPLVVPTELQREQVFTNAFKVSDINNPFTFPTATTYQVGNGEIRALASNAIALSTGQFGEYPLYVFCSDGVFAMYVGGGSITYSASRPVARDVCTNLSSVKSVDGGVIFVTERGVMIISGTIVKELSLPLRGNVFNFTDTSSNDYLSIMKEAISRDKLVQLLDVPSTETFLEYARDCFVGYNYKEKEVWFVHPSKTYAYLYARGVWYKMKTKGTEFVEDYPNTFLFDLGHLYDIGEEEEASTSVMLLSRPIKMGTQGFKQAMRLVLRGLINTNTDKYSGLYIFGSYDCQKWAFLGGTEKAGLLQDIGTTIERLDCRFYRIGFVGELTPECNLNYLEVSVKPRLQDKIR